MEIGIREYRQSDRAAFVRLMEELQDYLVSVDDMKRLRRVPEYGESYAQRTLEKVAKNEGIVYVAEIESRLVGTAVGMIVQPTKEDLLEVIPSKDGKVLELFVEAKYRKKGVGTMLMSKLEDYFRKKKCDVSKVDVFVPNINAHRLYRNLGYVDREAYMTKKLPDH